MNQWRVDYDYTEYELTRLRAVLRPLTEDMVMKWYYERRPWTPHQKLTKVAALTAAHFHFSNSYHRKEIYHNSALAFAIYLKQHGLIEQPEPITRSAQSVPSVPPVQPKLPVPSVPPVQPKLPGRSIEEKADAPATKATIDDCPICLESPPRRMAYNCGHALVCVSCDGESRQDICPICRAIITLRIPLFQ